MVKHKNNLAKTVAKGATGVAITAGLIAAGAVLMDREVRENVGKSAQRGIRAVRDLVSEQVDGEVEDYQSFAHEIRPKKRPGKKDRAKKSAKK